MLTQQDPDTRAFECAVEVHYCDNSDHYNDKIEDIKLSEDSSKSDLKTHADPEYQVIVSTRNTKSSSRGITRNIEIVSFDNAFSPYIKPPV